MANNRNWFGLLAVLVFLGALLWHWAPSQNRTAEDPDSYQLTHFSSEEETQDHQKELSKAPTRSINQTTPALPAERPLPPLKKEREASQSPAGIRIGRSQIPVGSIFQSHRQSWRPVGARAIDRENYHSSLGEKLADWNGFVLYEAPPSTWEDMSVRMKDKPVVVNPNTGRLAIASGTITIRLRHADDVARYRPQNFQVLAAYPDSQLVFLRPLENTSLLAALNALSNDPSVEYAELEVYESRKEPK